MIFPEHTHLQTTRRGLIHFATRNIAKHVEIQHSDISRGKMDVNSIGYQGVKKGLRQDIFMQFIV